MHRLALAQSGDPLRSQGAVGRWNSRGVLITYLAEHPALAALEVLNYVGLYHSVQGYLLYRVEVEDALILSVPEHIDVRDYAQTRLYGDAWAAGQTSLGLRVRSVTGPDSQNLLLNQRHPGLLSLRPEFLGPYTFDDRVAALVEPPTKSIE